MQQNSVKCNKIPSISCTHNKGDFRFLHICQKKKFEITPHGEKFEISPHLSYTVIWHFSTCTARGARDKYQVCPLVNKFLKRAHSRSTQLVCFSNVWVSEQFTNVAWTSFASFVNIWITSVNQFPHDSPPTTVWKTLCDYHDSDWNLVTKQVFSVDFRFEGKLDFWLKPSKVEANRSKVGETKSKM